MQEIPLLYTELGPEFFKWVSETIGSSSLFKFSVDRISCAVDFVKGGYGYAFVTKSSVQEELLKGNLIQINLNELKPPSRKVYMLLNKNKMNSIAIRNWLDMMKE